MARAKVNRAFPGDDKHAVGDFNLTKSQLNAAVSGGNIRNQMFTFSLADTTAVATAYTDGDCLVELGTIDIGDLNVSHAGDYAADRICITKAYVDVKTAAGQTLVGTLKVSATSGTATNAALSSPTEIFGAGATYLNEIGADVSLTEADINLNSATMQQARPNIQFASTLLYLYLATTTAVNADITAGRGTVVIEYVIT